MSEIPIRSVARPASRSDLARLYTDAEGVVHSINSAGIEMPMSMPGLASKALAGAADYSNNTAAFTDVPGVSFAVKAGETWRFTFDISGQVSAASTGIRFRLNGPATSRVKYNVRGNVAALAGWDVVGWQAAFGVDANTLWTSAGANTDLSAQLVGAATFTADGVVQLQARAITAGNVLTIHRSFTAVSACRVGLAGPATLGALSLLGNTVESGTGAGTLVGVIAGKTDGSTLSLNGNAGSRFALSGNNIVTGATPTDFAVATSHSITVRETLAGATNTPRDTALAITVTEAVTGIDPLTPSQAARFLNSGTMGATESEMIALTGADQAEMDAWFATQAAATPSITGITASFGAGSSGTPWLQNAVTGPDQLRQRMTLALSEILVASTVGVFAENGNPIAAYGDLLTNGALGRYRTLVGNVSRHSAMGQYLTHFKNEKANVSTGRRPDENYAREVMQLFTVGLNQLNLDGTLALVGGLPVPTYGQTEIINTAAVFTGLGPNFDGSRGAGTTVEQQDGYWQFNTAPENRDMRPMGVYPTRHETAAKTVIGGTVIASGGTVDSDIDAVLDALCEHPSCAPFISRQLIQRLVTSNPTPGYVQRVATRWLETYDDPDHLLQVAKAVLLDNEALNPPPGSQSALGKAQSPLYQTLRLLRAFGAYTENAALWDDTQIGFGLNAMRANFLGAPSVFNFYRPDFEVPTQPGLQVPELQIVTEATVAQTAELMFKVIFRFRASNDVRYETQFFNEIDAGDDLDGVYLNFAPWEARAATPTTLVNDLALLLTGDRMPAADRTVIASAVAEFGNGGAAPPIAAQKVLAAAALFGIAPSSTVN